MAKDQKTPERFAVEAMTLAMGALHMARTEANGADHVIQILKVAIDKFDPRCDHDWSNGALRPQGGVQAECRKCHVVRYAE